MTARSASVLMGSVVRNSGTVQAQTIANKGGRIMLMGDMTSGTTEVNGSLDASAPNGGDGGFIETSAGKVKIADEVRITTLAAQGKTGNWLVDPNDFKVVADTGLAFANGDMTGTTLATQLATTNVELQSAAGNTAGSGNVNISDRVQWSANTTLTLTASNDVNVYSNIVATGNTAGLVIRPNTTHTAGGVTRTASGSGTFLLQSGKEIVMTGQQANVEGVSQAYVKVTPGESIYGSTPLVSFTLFDQSSGGNDITQNFSLTGAPTWSENVSNTAAVGSYTLRYVNGLYLNQNFVTRIINTPSNWSVTPKAITYSGLTVPSSKVYDGTTAAQVTGTPTLNSKALGTGTDIDGLFITGDAISLTGTKTGTYNSKDVSSATSVSFSGLSLAGPSSSNYSLTQQSSSSATITPKTISTGLTVPSSKVYDGTTTAAVSGTPTLNSTTAGTGNSGDGLFITGDAISLSGTATGTYNSKDIASANTISITGLSLADISSPNYSILLPLTYKSVITMPDIGSKISVGNVNIDIVKGKDKDWLNSPITFKSIPDTTTRTAALANAGLTVIANAQMSQLTPAQLQAITPANFSALNPSQVASLTVQQFQLLSPSQLRSLSTAHVAALSGEQLKSVSNSQLNSFTPTQVSALTLRQIEALGTTQLITLNEAQIASLTPSQLAALLPTTISKLRESQLQACLLYTSPSPRDRQKSRMPSSA